MGCKYEYYKPEEKYCPRLYCNIDEKVCIYSKKCLKLDKFIPLEGEKWKECYKYIMEMQKEIPNGSVFVQLYRPNKRGNLIIYVVFNNRVEKIQTNLKELNQNYVYIRDGLEGYEVSLTPFPEKTYTKSRSVQRREEILKEAEQEPKKEIKKRYRKNNDINETDEKELSGLIEEE